jgi:alkanesulfonate monooxygenase SsuD/methylene tetrahydromethanopterin reductase-like flavin-dependent oxidoreductase (luciferase family)
VTGEEAAPRRANLGAVTPAPPFAPGSISIRLYPHNELEAADVVGELCQQAALALELGFDGVMTSEHHGGFPGYLPNPLQITTFILDDTAGGWAAPCPLLLPLRPTAMLAEEIAWLDARHPGRVGLGVAAGALPLDFVAMGLRVEDAVPRFKAELPRIVDMLRGRDLHGLDGDRALQRCAEHPVPVLSAAVSTGAARRAARCGAGILLEGMSAVEQLAATCAAFDEAGGTAPKVLIRRVWIGEPLTDLIARQRQVYASVGTPSAERRPFADDQTVISTDPDEIVTRLVELMTRSGADTLNLRVHLPGIPPRDIRDQIVRLANEVVPALRARGWGDGSATDGPRRRPGSAGR